MKRTSAPRPPHWGAINSGLSGAVAERSTRTGRAHPPKLCTHLACPRSAWKNIIIKFMSHRILSYHKLPAGPGVSIESYMGIISVHVVFVCVCVVHVFLCMKPHAAWVLGSPDGAFILWNELYTIYCRKSESPPPTLSRSLHVLRKGFNMY